MALELVFECPSTLAKLRTPRWGSSWKISVSRCWSVGSVVGRRGFIWGICLI